MIPKVVQATYQHDFIVHLKFDDGTQGDVDLADELYGQIFEPLRDVKLFMQVVVHPEFQTICWPNGADFAPEFLYERVRVPA